MVQCYCKECGYVFLPPQLRDGRCSKCGSLETGIHEVTTCFEPSELIRERYVYNNPLFDPEKNQQRIESEEANAAEMADMNRLFSRDSNTPKCPTCGSTNIKKISGASKVGKVALFGIFAAGSVSKTFHCKNCSYKW